jgi:hypothetical protein
MFHCRLNLQAYKTQTLKAMKRYYWSYRKELALGMPRRIDSDDRNCLTGSCKEANCFLTSHELVFYLLCYIMDKWPSLCKTQTFLFYCTPKFQCSCYKNLPLYLFSNNLIYCLTKIDRLMKFHLCHGSFTPRRYSTTIVYTFHILLSSLCDQTIKLWMTNTNNVCKGRTRTIRLAACHGGYWRPALLYLSSAIRLALPLVHISLQLASAFWS